MTTFTTPTDSPAMTPGRKLERLTFKYANTYVMLPALRAGLGRWMSSPATGYFIILQTTGRKSGRPRLTPLNYALDGGDVICLAGFGEHAHWLANLREDPRVRVQLRDRVISGVATPVADPNEARRLAVKVARASGFALVFEHPRCLLMTEDQLADQLAGRPVVRIRPEAGPLTPGPHDPGGRGWILSLALQSFVLLILYILLFRWRPTRH